MLLASSTVKAPVISPWVDMAPSIVGAEMILLSRMMAKRLPMFSVVNSPTRWPPWLLKRSVMSGRPFWSYDWLASVSIWPLANDSRLTTSGIGGRPGMLVSIKTSSSGGTWPDTASLGGTLSSTAWKVSFAVLPMTAFSFSGSLSPGASTTMRSTPCRSMTGSLVPSWSMRRRTISMSWSTACAVSAVIA